jgi:hypothetical protein
MSEEALRVLSPMDRFSIAHELAHLMFLKQSGKKPGDLFFTRPGTLHSLEVECNHLARALLIPKGQLLREIGTNLFDATIIGPLMDRFRVWPGVFIWRLQLDDVANAFPNSNGMLAYAEDGPSGVTIRAARLWGPKATHPYMPQDKNEKYIPMLGPQGRPIQDVRIKLDLHEFLRNTEMGKIETDVRWHSAQGVACTLSVVRISSNPLQAVFALDITGEIV